MKDSWQSKWNKKKLSMSWLLSCCCCGVWGGGAGGPGSVLSFPPKFKFIHGVCQDKQVSQYGAACSNIVCLSLSAGPHCQPRTQQTPTNSRCSLQSENWANAKLAAIVTRSLFWLSSLPGQQPARPWWHYRMMRAEERRALLSLS